MRCVRATEGVAGQAKDGSVQRSLEAGADRHQTRSGSFRARWRWGRDRGVGVSLSVSFGSPDEWNRRFGHQGRTEPDAAAGWLADWRAEVCIRIAWRLEHVAQTKRQALP